MADKKIILEVELLEGDAQSKLDVLNASLKNLDKTHKDYKPTLELIKDAERELSKVQEKRILIENRLASSTGKVDKATKNTTKVLNKQSDATKNTTNVLNKQSDATGSATAATMELSRVVSDAPYGIRGMANNITQLVSQLGTASMKAGGLTKALKLMWTQMMGPLGIVFAITAAVAALDYFKGGMKKAKEENKELNDELEKTSKILAKINTVLDTLNVTGDSVNFEWMDSFMAGVDKLDAKGLLKVLERDIKGITAAFNKLPKENQNIQGIESLVQKKKDLVDNLLIEKEIRAELIELDKEYLAYRSLGDSKTKTELTEEIVRKQKELFATQKAIIDTEELFKGKGGKEVEIKKISPLKTPKEFEGDLFEIEDMLRKFSGKELLRNAKTEEEKNTAKAIIELEGFKKSFQDFRLSEDEKLVEFMEVLEKKRLAEIASAKGNKKRISEINAIFDKTSLDAQETYELESTISYNNYITGLKAIVDKNKPDLILGELGRTELDRDKATEAAQEKHLTFRLENFAEYADTAKQAISSMTDFINGEYDRELIMEQNKTNSLNTELNNRLLNENLSKEQRRKIQNEIAQNDEKLRVRQEIIEKKRFKTNKAANIASALMDTATAAVGVMKDSKGDFFARLAQAIPTIAFGLAQVAIIARQKFQSSASKTPISTTGGGGSSGGGGSERAEPSFNIVGRSDDNLLINAIQATFDKPLKAYVVARDVTNQQQLDGIITDKAGT